jgi:RNA polymerase sigma factor (sigma-70 family)
MAEGHLRNVLRFVRSVVRARASGDATDRSLLERFAVGHDEDAFAALVHRHGPMVQGVCRRVLGHAQDAEDAYQATFLVLARKAGGVHWHADVGSWLYQVACRTALKLRAGRKWVRERPLADLPGVPAGGADAHDVGPILDEELARLPQKYRAPVVLHYLEGKTYAETARLLGWAEGTVSGRLARARDALRKRLARRGLALSGAFVATTLAGEAGAAALSASEIQATVRVVRLFVAGEAAGECARVVALAEGVLKNMFLSKLKVRALAALAVSLAGVGLALLVRPPQPAGAAAGPPEKAKARGLVWRAGVGQPPIGDPGSILHIQKFNCGLEVAREEECNLVVELEVYKDGRKVNYSIKGGGVSSTSGGSRLARIALQAADLDYLPLAGGGKGQCRVQIEMEMDGGYTRSSTTTDVPKDVFDFSKRLSSGDFVGSAGSATESPLFYLTAGKTSTIAATSVQDVIKDHPKGDLLIAYLRIAK